MPEVSLTAWNSYLENHPDAHLLQSGEWGELKSAFGWDPVRLIPDEGPGV
jgi:peptidoglycan pentaglycine glycine transferase (the first glycine)